MTSGGKLRLERQYKGDAAHGVGREKGADVSDYHWFVGIDWGTEQHTFCVVDAAGHVQGTRAVSNDLAGLTAAWHWVRGLSRTTPDRIAVGLETPRGLVVDAAMDQGFALFAVNPKQLDRFRDRFTAAGAKDDPRDAQAIADGLRTDRRAFRPIAADAPGIIELRELARMADDLTADIRRQANRLREQLLRVDAPWLDVCPAADEAWLWTALTKWPHPERWAQLTRREATALLRRHRIRRLTADALVGLTHQPRVMPAAGVAAAVASRVATLVPQLVLLHDQLRRTERQIDQRLMEMSEPESDSEPAEHRDAAILQSVPGIGRMVTATLLAEASSSLSARQYDSVRALAGTAPVTKRSGKRLRVVHMRYACNGRLRQALYHWARTSLQTDAATRAYYDRLRARGLHHARALRSVGDRWLRILIAMLKSRTLYDASRWRFADAPST